jgi:ABC-type taurine transport system substrate-binding protein
MRQTGKDREAQIAAAKDGYRQAARLFKLIRLRYFVQDNMRAAAFPPGMAAASMDQMTGAQVDAVTREVERLVRQQGWDSNSDDVAEYVSYVQRCAARLNALQ